jgi:hypothetical protein
MPETAFKGSPLAKARADVAIAYRRKDSTPQAIETARRNFATEKIAAFVQKVLAEAPPLNDEQRTRLAELLRPVRRGGAAS